MAAFMLRLFDTNISMPEETAVQSLTQALAAWILCGGLLGTLVLTFRTWIVEADLKRSYAMAQQKAFATLAQEDMRLFLGKLLKELGLERDGRAYIYVPDNLETTLRVDYRSDGMRGGSPDLDFSIPKGQGWMWQSFLEYVHITDDFSDLLAHEISVAYGNLDIRYCESFLQQGVKAFDCRPIYDGYDATKIAGVLVIDSRQPAPLRRIESESNQQILREALAYARSLMARTTHLEAAKPSVEEHT